MDIERALKLQPGDQVRYPADRGDPAGIGKVEGVSLDVSKNIHGDEFIWISVWQPALKHTSVWPSNRLSQ